MNALVTDRGLPGMSGEELAKLARDAWPPIGIIFATGADTTPDLAEPSTVTLLTKPFGPVEIEQAIERIKSKTDSD